MSEPRERWTDGVARYALRAAVVALPLATSLHEIALALLLATVVISTLLRRNFSATAGAIAERAPWIGAALVFALCCLFGALPHGNLHEGLGHAWLLTPLLAVPMADSSEKESSTLTLLGLGAATTAALWGIAQRIGGAAATAGFGHHLTLAYALIPAFAVSISQSRWSVALVLGAGSLATGSDAVPVALLVAAFAAFMGVKRPAAASNLPLALALGVAGNLGGMALFAVPDDLRQRAILWTGGLMVSPGGAGAGGYAAATERLYDALSPGFYFPNHAHDSAIQLYATLGPAGIAAMALLVATILYKGHTGAAAGVAAVAIGGMTQDTCGDLEVARAAWMWVALLGARALPETGQ